MRLRPSLFLFLLILLLAAPVFCAATESSADLQAILLRLKTAAEGTRSLSSRFVQEKQLAIFAEKLLSEGRFIYQKPDRLRWELLTPVNSGFVLQGAAGERWNGLSREKTVFRTDQDPLMGMIAKQLLAWARLDTEWLQSRYRIELRSEQPVVFQLFPLDKGEAGLIESLQIRFSSDLVYVETVEMNEQSGDKTLLRFQEVQLNQDLPPAAFVAPEF